VRTHAIDAPGFTDAYGITSNGATLVRPDVAQPRPARPRGARPALATILAKA